MTELKVLLVEDLATDAEIAQRTLAQHNLSFHAAVVDNEADFRQALHDFQPDVVISDYAMPTFDGMSALKITRSQSVERPFIILTGSMNEETAVACMKAGADDYVIKEKIRRLPFAVLEAIEKHQIRRKKDEAEAKVKHNLERLQALRNIETAIASTLELDEVLQILLTEINQMIPSDALSIQILREDKLEIIASRGFTEGEKLRGITFPLSPKFPNTKVIQTKKVATFADIQVDYPHFFDEKDAYLTHGIRSWMGVPLIAREEVIGMISFDRRELHPFSEEEIGVVSVFSNQAAIAIYHAQLFSRAERRLNNLKALQRIDMAISGSLDIHLVLNVILDHITKQLEVDAANVLLLNPHLNTLEYAANRGFHTTALQGTKLKMGEGQAGLAALEQRPIHVHDLRKTETGFLLSPELKKEGFRSYLAVPLIAKGEVQGAIELFHRSALRPDPEWYDLLSTLSTQAAIAIDNANLFKELQRSNMEISLAYESTLEGWASALELKDAETKGHSQRVLDLTMKLSRKLGINGKPLGDIRRGALLHDIGKMGIPDSILQKEGPLDEGEWKIMKQHPDFAYSMLSEISFLKDALEIPYCHHERWDGTGYPRGLSGKQIPLSARIFAVVDVWDALLSKRSYRPAWPKEKALTHIEGQAGTHFDPQVVEAFFELLEYESGYGDILDG